MDPLTVRVAHADDVDDVLALWAAAAENSDRPADSSTAVLHLLERDPDALLLAIVDGVLIGTIIAGWDGWRAHLYRLAVHPAYRRRGVGQALLEQAEARLAEQGARRLDAMVLDHNTLGASLWASMGYERQTSWARWVKPV